LHLLLCSCSRSRQAPIILFAIIGKTITYAHAFVDSTCNGCGGDRKWGWANINNGACQVVYNGSALNRQFFWYAQSTDGTMKWTSNSWNFQHTSQAHTQCFDLGQLNLNRCVNGTYQFEAQYPYYKHRIQNTTQTDDSLTLVP